MKLVYVLAATALLFSAGSWAKEDKQEAFYNFLSGSYVCIGKWPDSNDTYLGRVEIATAKQGLNITRTIQGKTIKAVGKVDTAMVDNIQVLKVAFKHKGIDYEETCMVSSDLDNYARLSCYLYSKETKKVGLETLFPDQGQLERQ